MRFNVFTMTDLIGWDHTGQQLQRLHHRTFLHLNTLTLITHIAGIKCCKDIWASFIPFAFIIPLYYSNSRTSRVSFMVKKKRSQKVEARGTMTEVPVDDWILVLLSPLSWEICYNPPWILIVSTAKLLVVISTAMSVGSTAGLTLDLYDYIRNLSLFSLKWGFYVSVASLLPKPPKQE